MKLYLLKQKKIINKIVLSKNYNHRLKSLINLPLLIMSNQMKVTIFNLKINK